MEQLLNFKLLLAIAIIGNALVIFGSFFYRAWKGKPELRTPDFELTFSEKWVSGSSDKSGLTKPGGASNCLVVEMTRSSLVIRPMFPFSLAPLGKVYDLEHSIPKSKIKQVELLEDGGRGDRGRVVVEFESESGVRRFELLLRKRQEFARAIGASVRRQPVPSGILT